MAEGRMSTGSGAEEGSMARIEERLKGGSRGYVAIPKDEGHIGRRVLRFGVESNVVQWGPILDKCHDGYFVDTPRGATVTKTSTFTKVPCPGQSKSYNNILLQKNPKYLPKHLHPSILK